MKVIRQEITADQRHHRADGLHPALTVCYLDGRKVKNVWSAQPGHQGVVKIGLSLPCDMKNLTTLTGHVVLIEFEVQRDGSLHTLDDPWMPDTLDELPAAFLKEVPWP